MPLDEMTSTLLSNLDFKVDNIERTYYPGDTIEGSLDCCFVNPKNVKGVFVSLLGQEETMWYRRNPGEITSTKSSGFNTFLSEKLSLLQDSPKKNRLNRNFRCQLPRNIPSTYKHMDGCIKYYVIASLFIEPADYEIEEKIEIEIMSPVDFNKMEDLTFLGPYTINETRDFPVLCCHSESIDIEINFPTRGFIIGQETKIAVDLRNRTNRKVERVEVVIGQTVMTKANFMAIDTKETKEVLLVSQLQGIPNYSYTEKMYEFIIKVPNSVKRPNLTRCKLFKYSSWAEVVIVVDGTDIVLPTQIMLGHIPLGVQTTENRTVSAYPAPSAPVINPYGHTEYPLKTRETMSMPVPMPMPTLSFTSSATPYSNILPNIPSNHPSISMAPSSSSGPLPREPPPSYEAAMRENNPKIPF